MLRAAATPKIFGGFLFIFLVVSTGSSPALKHLLLCGSVLLCASNLGGKVTQEATAQEKQAGEHSFRLGWGCAAT